jgi:hypothetical protein
MFKNGKTALVVAITLGVLGTASTAFAAGKDDDGAGHDRWEGKSGPSGQVFSSGQAGWISQSDNAFAQAPTSQTKQKASKAAKKDSSTANKGETEEQARLRRYYDNR